MQGSRRVRAERKPQARTVGWSAGLGAATANECSKTKGIPGASGGLHPVLTNGKKESPGKLMLTRIITNLVAADSMQAKLSLRFRRKTNDGNDTRKHKTF